MTMAQRIKVHHEMEQRNRQREKDYRKPVVAAAVTADRKALRSFLKRHSA